MSENRNNNQVELVSEMMARYTNEWIFFEVVEDDEYERPHKGRLIAHNPHRDEIHKAVMERKDVYHIAVWYTGELIPKGDLILL